MRVYSGTHNCSLQRGDIVGARMCWWFKKKKKENAAAFPSGEWADVSNRETGAAVKEITCTCQRKIKLRGGSSVNLHIPTQLKVVSPSAKQRSSPINHSQLAGLYILVPLLWLFSLIGQKGFAYEERLKDFNIYSPGMWQIRRETVWESLMAANK